MFPLIIIVIFREAVDRVRDIRYEICDLLAIYAAQNRISVPTFRDNVEVPSSKVKQPKITRLGLLDP